MKIDLIRSSIQNKKILKNTNMNANVHEFNYKNKKIINRRKIL